MAEGPPIQKAALRGLKAGLSMKGTLELAHDFRDLRRLGRRQQRRFGHVRCGRGRQQGQRDQPRFSHPPLSVCCQ